MKINFFGKKPRKLNFFTFIEGLKKCPLQYLDEQLYQICSSDEISSIIPNRPLIPFMISSNRKSMTDYRLQNVFIFIWIISYFVEVLIRFQSSAIAYNKYEIYIDPNSYCTVLYLKKCTSK